MIAAPTRRSVRSVRALCSGICAPLLALAASCTTVEGTLSLVVPDGVDPAAVDLSRIAEGVTVVGHDSVSLVLIVPLSRLSVADALASAIGDRTDVVLVDVTVERHVWWAVLYGEASLRLEGVMVPLPRPAAHPPMEQPPAEQPPAEQPLVQQLPASDREDGS